MKRWAVGIEYNGTRFCGWQAQAGRDSVQTVLQGGLSRVAGTPVQAWASGRTDAGVHAFGQVIHFDCDVERAPRAWLLGGNSNLPGDVSVRWVHEVCPEFHARHSARARHYRYVVHNAAARSALLRDRAAWITGRLDAVLMHAAAQLLLGERDFSSFRAAECQSSTPMRCVISAEVWRRDTFVGLDICANAFLHHMVRNIMGTLIEIGLRRRPVEWMSELLAARDRRCAAATAPACGLYFVGPEYPRQFQLPAAVTPWFPA